MNRMPANAAMLRPGQRVLVQAQGQQAIGIRILAGNQYGGVRRGIYYAGRGPHIVKGSRATQAAQLGNPQKAAKTAGANQHRASVTHRATHVAAKGK